MRKRIKKKTMGRDRAHRRALLKNLSTQLVTHEQITTTVSKAKFLRPHVEKLITKAKGGSNFNNVKYMKKMLSTADAVEKILADVGPRFISRPGGYTRIVKTGNRQGDNAPMARIELVEKRTAKKVTKKAKKEDAKSKEKPKEKKVEKRVKEKKLEKKSILKKPRGRPRKSFTKEK